MIGLTEIKNLGMLQTKFWLVTTLCLSVKFAIHQVMNGIPQT
jgi:hypothetical protein